VGTPLETYREVETRVGASNRAASLFSDEGLVIRKRFRHSTDAMVLDEAEVSAKASTSPPESNHPPGAQYGRARKVNSYQLQNRATLVG
jgi:hypothetical protein